MRLPVAATGVLLVVVVAAGLAACSFDGQPPGPAMPAVAAGSGQAEPSDGGTPPSPGPREVDSFGNVLYYTATAGDTLAAVAGAFGVSEANLADFNRLASGVPVSPGMKLRLIPPAGPITGASGAATIDHNGIPTTYMVADEDTIGGITYRFGLTMEQLAEANKVPYVYETGNKYFLQAGTLIQLQKNPVDSRSGTGVTVKNSFGQADYYTTVEGDSFDSLGYKFRSTTQQLLLYNPALTAGRPIPAGTTVSLIPGDLKIDGAQGTFTANADGVPITYTTAPGDIERQVAFRFNLQILELESANRPLTPGAGSWFDYADLPAGELAPGQTISLTAEQPINR